MKKSLIRPKCKCIECGSIESGSNNHFKNKIVMSNENKKGTGVRILTENEVLRNEFLSKPTTNNKTLIKTKRNKNNI